MRKWPWILLLLVAAIAVSPIGQDFIYSAFFSNEQWSRIIVQPIALMALAFAGMVVLLEWWIGRMVPKPPVEN